MHENKLQKFSQQFDAELANMKEKMQREINTLKDEISKKNNEIEKMKNQMSSNQQDFEREKKQYEEKIKNLNVSVADLKDQVEIYQTKLIQKQQELENLMKEQENILKSRSQEHEEKMTQLRAHFKKQMDQLIQEHLKEAQEMQEEFNQVKDLMESRYKELMEQYQQLQTKFDTRPPRDEDLKLIQELQQLVIQKEEALKRAFEDMKFYKLELINREENYNKVFGSNPNVGVLNPIPVKKTLAQQQSSRKDAHSSGLNQMATGQKLANKVSRSGSKMLS